MNTHSPGIKSQMPAVRDTRTQSTQYSNQSYYDVLKQLAALLGSSAALDEVLHALTALTRQITSSDLCVLLLADQQQRHLFVQSCLPDLHEKGAIFRRVQLDSQLCQHLQECFPPALTAQELEALSPLENVQYKTLLPLPLLVGGECIGLLNCYSSQVVAYSSEQQLIFSMLASQAALTIKHRQREESGSLTQAVLADVLLEELFSGRPGYEAMLSRRAHFLGCDLAQPHQALILELAPIEAQELPATAAQSTPDAIVFEQIQQHIQASYPGSLLCAHHRSLLGLLRPGQEEQAHAWFATLVHQMRMEHGVHLSVGIGTCYHRVSEYHHSFNEAREALEIELCLHQLGGCSYFSHLGAYRYIYQFARTETVRDQYQEDIDSIAAYDQRKKVNLLDTLETYLECGGNIAKAAGLLTIHRNTLLQRLERLQSLCVCDLQTDSHRLPLLVALKIARLRAHRAPATYSSAGALPRTSEYSPFQE